MFPSEATVRARMITLFTSRLGHWSALVRPRRLADNAQIMQPASSPTVYALLLLAALCLPGPGVAEEFVVEEVTPDPVPVQVENRWALSGGYGGQWYGDGLDRGAGYSVQLLYRAHVDTPEEGRWLFELGLEHARSERRPEVDDEGRRARIVSSGAFYRFNRMIGGSVYVGARLGLSRVRGTDEKSDLDLVVGVQSGLRLTDWLDFTVELVAADPSVSGPSGAPADLRAGLIVSF